MSAPQPTAEYSAEERKLLLAVARRAIEHALHHESGEGETVPPHLKEARGVFTTIYTSGGLRGCVGQPFAAEPLAAAVASTAVSAATRDPRFPPLTVAELEQTRISISVLSPMFDIAPEQIEIGRHGLLISSGYRRGLLLPEVAERFGWDATTFLEQACYKAGLPADAWHKGASVEAFTTEQFSEDD